MSIIKYIMSLPKTLFFNFKVFPFKTAIKLPCWLHYHTKIGPISKNSIIFNTENIRPGMIKLGCSMGSSGVFEGEYPKANGGGYIHIKPSCKIIFNGSAFFAGGFSIRIDNGGVIEIGNNFGCNSYCFFAANKKICFGDDCTLGWKVKIRDVDGHKIYNVDDPDKSQININKEVYIGNHVWLASYVKILKGTYIADDSVIAYGTILTGQNFQESNCIIGGNPPHVLKKNIGWRF